ncbi:MAG TPA: DUF5010 domain-containing protein [Verrucomicrobiae bacterium]|jgi:hypothetical protein|nr:DUF5010 domain-containing protein [Verrucomicrobiae bacterium]
MALALAQAVFGRELPPAFGPYLHPTAADFGANQTFHTGDRMVGTYYFYWYDAPSKTHVINAGLNTDALTDHPPTLEGFSWKSVDWHKKQLSDMEAAGIDVALMVFWGAPSEQDAKADLHWSYEGLAPLVEARDALVRAGKHPPKIGLFYDTSTLQYNSWHEHIDLTTDFGRQWFYATVRDFFSCIPARDWAMIDNKPIILLYSADFARNHDHTFVTEMRARFAEDFSGRTPWLAPQNSWRAHGDSTCAWGGALGLKRAGIAELGPGYDHSAVPGRTPLVVPREGGKFYEENWLKFLRRPTPFVMLETWNEFHEGTEICASKEYGRRYIDLTRQYSDRFKKGWRPATSSGAFYNARAVEIGAGLKLLQNDDGETTSAAVLGSTAIKAAGARGRYIYFAVDDSFKWSDAMSARLEVEYFDGGRGEFTVEFDGSDPHAPFAGAYTGAGKSVALRGEPAWKTASFDLRGARFWNSENRASDFRLVVLAAELYVRQVRLIRN